MNKIKINLLSHGRFHMVDLTRELKKQGFDVKLYSFVPPKMCKKTNAIVDAVSATIMKQ